MSHALYETTEPYYPARDHSPKDFAEYLMPGPAELPADRERRARDARRANGPYGAKGVGEMTANSPIPAIVNAIYHACGVRVDHLPVRARGHPARARRSSAAGEGSSMSQITTWDEFPTVEYVKGVLRQTVSGEKVMVTRIVYQDGVIIPEHSHEAEQIMLVVSRPAVVQGRRRGAEVGPGSILVIPSNWVHAFRQLGDEDVVFYEAFAPIRLEYLVGFKGPDPSLAMMHKRFDETDESDRKV